MAFFSEAQLETALLEQLASPGFACTSDELIGPDGNHRELLYRQPVIAEVSN